MRPRGLGRGALFAVVGVLVVGAGSASAATLTVTTTMDETASGDGQCSLREAIAAVDAPGTASDCGVAANAGNTIALGSVTYTLSIHPSGPDDNSTGDLDVQGTTGLTIEGGGAGATVISGTGLEDRLLSVISGAVTLQDLTLSNGQAPNGPDGVGTATSGKAPTAGQSGSDGGAMSNAGTVILDHVAITNNSAGNGGNGGHGLAVSFSDADGAPGGSGGRGGGIYNATAGSLTLTDVTMSANRSGNGGNGGGGANGDPVGAGGAGGCCGDGGGLFNNGGHVAVTGSTFTQNIAGDGGSGGSGGDPSSLSGTGGAGGTGQGGSSGGAIATAGGSVSITNSTIAGNLSGRGGDGGDGGFNPPPGAYGAGGNAGNGSAGGGIFARNAAVLTLGSDTIAQNQPGGPGTPGTGSSAGKPGAASLAGGLYANAATVNVQSTLLAANVVGNCGGPSAPTDQGQNLSFGDTTCPAGFATGDPKLGPLQDNGGPTQTMRPGAGSAAVDHVPASGAGCPSSDQRGVPRPSGAACDIGAYEVATPVVSTGAASPVTSSSATVGGAVTPNAGAATVDFEYGTTTTYGSSTAIQNLGGITSTPVTAQIAGLAPSTTYHYRLVATSPDGSQAGADQTFTTGSPPPAGANGGQGAGAGAGAVAQPPKLGRLSLRPTSFRTRRRKHHLRDKIATTLTYTDSQASAATFTVRRCTKFNRRRGCVRYVRVGTFTHADQAGQNTFKWNGRTSGRPLKPGSYRLELTARAGGLASATVTAVFTILR